MRVYGDAPEQVEAKLPPSTGAYAGWDWRTFYNAIETAILRPRSQYHYMAAFSAVDSLPPQMVFTLTMLAAAWARFSLLHPYWNNQYAWKLMLDFTKATGRFEEGDDRQWWLLEQEWKALERAQVSQLRGGFAGFR